MPKHPAHRPWWKPGSGNNGGGSWSTNQAPVIDGLVRVIPAPPPEPDEVVLVHDPRTNAPMAVYRRFVRE